MKNYRYTKLMKYEVYQTKHTKYYESMKIESEQLQLSTGSTNKTNYKFLVLNNVYSRIKLDKCFIR